MHDSFISYRTVIANNAFIRANGLAKYAALAGEKQQALQYLLDNYDDGRSKLFLCTACQLIPLSNLKEAVGTINS